MTMVATYKTKKRLKECVGESLAYRETSMFGPEYKSNGEFSVVGPSEHSRKWFARITMKDGKIAKVT